MAIMNLKSEYRAQFIEMIRRENYSKELLYMIGTSQYGLSRIEVDKCIDDALIIQTCRSDNVSDEKKKEIVDHMLAHDRYWANYEESARRERAAQEAIEAEAKRRRKENLQAAGGGVLFLVMSIINLFPLVGAIATIIGIIGFISGSENAGRFFLFGICFLAVKPVFSYVFLKIVSR